MSYAGWMRNSSKKNPDRRLDSSRNKEEEYENF